MGIFNQIGMLIRKKNFFRKNKEREKSIVLLVEKNFYEHIIVEIISNLMSVERSLEVRGGRLGVTT
jgi:hypothetical protein